MSSPKFEKAIMHNKKAMTTPDAPESKWRLTLFQQLADSQPTPSPLGNRLATLMGSGHRLFHYTTAGGLKGIVDDNCLWATAASYLNDASEIEYGCTLLEEVFRKWLKANDANIFSAAIVRLLRDIFNGPHSKLERATGIYVACFCVRNNLLSQWRAYAQDGGYSIGFSLVDIGLQALAARNLTGIKPESDAYRANLVRVIYHKPDQLAVLEDVLKRNLHVLERADVQALYESLDAKEQKEFIGTAVIFIEHFLMEQIVAFKNKAFEEEKEWRVVVRSPFGRGSLFDGKKDKAVHLRSARGLIIPYVKLVPTDSRLPIRSVTIGPSLDKTRAMPSVRLLLIQNDLASVAIDGSDIPVVM